MANHITINGQTYSSVDEMPPDVRRQYEAAMQLLATNSGVLADGAARHISISTAGGGPARNAFKVVTQTTATRLVVDGKEYARWENAPPEARAALESAGVNPHMPFPAGKERAADATQAAGALKSLRRMIQLGSRGLLAVVAVASVAGIVFHFAVGSGLFGPMRWANWGPGQTTQAVQLPDGRHAILLHHFGRIQMYSPDLQFLYGWNTYSLGGVLRISPDGNLNLYLPRRSRVKNGGWDHEVYDVDGALLSRDSRGPDPRNANLPGRGGQLVHVPDGSPWWWTFTFWGPFCAFGTLCGVLAVGIILSYALYTREERQAYRRKRMSRRASAFT